MISFPESIQGVYSKGTPDRFFIESPGKFSEGITLGIYEGFFTGIHGIRSEGYKGFHVRSMRCSKLFQRRFRGFHGRSRHFHKVLSQFQGSSRSVPWAVLSFPPQWSSMWFQGFSWA